MSETEVCGSHNAAGKVCRRFEGHEGEHYNPGYSDVWTDEEAVEFMEPVPVVVAGTDSVRFARVGDMWLSRREVQVLQTAADGLTTVEASERLGLHRNTVKTHKRRIAKKLGALNTAHAVAMCFRGGVLK